MKMKYENPEMNVILFLNMDVITSSDELNVFEGVGNEGGEYTEIN